jgi:hypothetical protein
VAYVYPFIFNDAIFGRKGLISCALLHIYHRQEIMEMYFKTGTDVAVTRFLEILKLMNWTGC